MMNAWWILLILSSITPYLNGWSHVTYPRWCSTGRVTYQQRLATPTTTRHMNKPMRTVRPLLTSIKMMETNEEGDEPVVESVSLHQMTKDVLDMTPGQVMRAVCGKYNISLLAPTLSIPGITMEPYDTKPLVTRFLVPSPYHFLMQPELAKQYGLDFLRLHPNVTMRQLGYFLPVIYLADELREFGTLGLTVNRLASTTMMDLYPTLKKLRDRPIYQGGSMKRGNALTMVHRIAGFPENRPWKGLSDSREFKLFFSPDIGMANELCMTNDAKPSDFKFFQFATVWSPRQLESEMTDNHLWRVIKAPISLLMDDDPAAIEVDEPKVNTRRPSLFERIMWSASFPEDSVS